MLGTFIMRYLFVAALIVWALWGVARAIVNESRR